MFHKGFSRRRMLGLAAAGIAIATGAAHAQESWPSRPIRIVVGNSAGGTQDPLARIAAAGMSKELGVPVVVENRPGANSNIGAELTARAKPDGYTLFVYSTSTAINATLYTKLNYDPIKDFDFVGLIGGSPNVLVVNPNLPAHSVADLVRLAKESKTGINFASSGTGSSTHLSAQMMTMQSGLNIVHVPYKGAAPALSDLMGGQVDAMFNAATSTVALVQAGKLRALAVTSSKRMEQLPDVPTLAESGFPGFDVMTWNGLVVPAGTPKPIVAKLNAALNKTLAMPATVKAFADSATSAMPGSEEDMRKLAVEEIDRWRPVVKASGATLD
ncbi:Bug family tripartite tricarboxylate transporter substrate binding protein [Bordetella genomosp. 13]|uniref:Bug family tripartite tricarboxylate transporter substrate binding protein n=1 Tax=Bordetella genomosp. 13 TaxID=463040 RepID=UPI0011A1C449|nr:tripartite tricarboxylate transporter substrate binding protein [Bordetella genomosp. 13]